LRGQLAGSNAEQENLKSKIQALEADIKKSSEDAIALRKEKEGLESNLTKKVRVHLLVKYLQLITLL